MCRIHVNVETDLIHRSYAGWITNMSGIDDRLVKALRAIRQGDWVYGVSTFWITMVKEAVVLMIILERYWFRPSLG